MAFIDAKGTDYINVSYTNIPNAVLTRVDACKEEPLRRLLNARHKERQAAKKAERRFYVGHFEDDRYWFVRDNDGHLHGTFEYPGCAESDAKAFAKMLNKRNRKPKGGERDG